ncbi:MAG: hypothetical protein D6820_15090, partial [Lentisphaerae bacterium]
GEAWNRPFTAVYEASRPNQCSITAVKRVFDGKFLLLEVEGQESNHLILSSETPYQVNRFQDYMFKGTFAVIAHSGKKSEFYLGKGALLQTPVCSIRSLGGSRLSASVRIEEDGTVRVRSNEECEVVFGGKKYRIQPGRIHTLE